VQIVAAFESDEFQRRTEELIEDSALTYGHLREIVRRSFLEFHGAAESESLAETIERIERITVRVCHERTLESMLEHEKKTDTREGEESRLRKYNRPG